MPAITEPTQDLPSLWIGNDTNNLMKADAGDNKQILADTQINFLTSCIAKLNEIKTGRVLKRSGQSTCFFRAARERTDRQIEYCEQLLADLTLFQQGTVRADIQIPEKSTFSQRIKIIVEHNLHPISSLPMSPLRGAFLPSCIAIYSEDLIQKAQQQDDNIFFSITVAYGEEGPQVSRHEQEDEVEAFEQALLNSSPLSFQDMVAEPPPVPKKKQTAIGLNM